MTRRIPLVVLFALALFSGCTPLGENIARRAPSGSAGDIARRTGPAGELRPAVVPLDAGTRQTLQAYGPAIKECAARYGFDWRLILAVIKQESRFEAEAESQKGASGLMQVMPVTQAEIAGRLSLDDTTHPAANIRIGVYYLRTQYALFRGVQEADRLKLALAAYNAGIGRVRDAQRIAAYLGDSPATWQAVKGAFPFLSKRYASLHSRIWSEDHPRNGWFGNARQTVAYVDSVMGHYEAYLRDLI